ncbi:MAG: NmrA/HSCARG family protein [Polyangiaceae bacterium]
MEKLTVFVTGATGQQGGHVARLLGERGHRVRALTRNGSSPAAQRLAALGADVVQGDLESEDGLADRMRGSDALFLVTTPFDRGHGAVEITQARTAGLAAKAAGVKHIVYSSAVGAEHKTGIEHFESKGEAEKALRGMDLPLTIVAAPPFMDNVLAHWNIASLRRGEFAMPVPRRFPMTQVAVADIAAFVVHAFERRGELLGQRVAIASEAVSGEQMKATLERVLGRPLEYVERSFAEIDPLLGRLFGGAGAAIGKDTPRAMPPMVDIESLRARYPEIAWHSFERWAQEQDFSQVMS